MISVSSQPVVFDRRLLRGRRLRAAALGPSTFLMERVAQDLSDRLATVLRRFDWAVDLGTPTNAVCRELARSGKIGTIVTATAPASSSQEQMGSEGACARSLAIGADEEALPFRDASLDLLVSALSLQFVNDLPGTLIQIRRALKPDGLFLAAMIGGDSLAEL